ncbi:MAG: anti-sigma factor [Pseudorhodoplanes sp.]
MSERDDLLAAEFVAGLLAPEARIEAERRVEREPAFAKRVEQWRTRLSDLDETAPPMTPDAGLWQRIERQIATSAQKSSAPPGWLSRLWNSIEGLRAATATSLAAACVFAIVAGVALSYATREAIRKPVYVAILVSDDTRQPGAVVNAFADGRVEMIPLTEINVPAGRALEIWTLWDRNVGPRSVGLIDRAQTVRLNLDKLPPTGPDQLFEITLEPAGGSPTGRPTGPILYKGTTSRSL